jgi:hypothetical protein
MIYAEPPFVHTPYDGSSTPFTIGLKPLDLSDWIEVDGLYPEYLAEKDRLIGERPEDVFTAEPGTEHAQREVADLVADHLTINSTTLFPTPREHDEAFSRLATFQLSGSDEPRLQAAARLVQEDLILMRKGDDGWRLAAGSLCFPSSWSLTEKFGKPMHTIHEPVPGFGAGTRNAELIERMFDRLQGQAVQRFNWSVQAGGALYHPLSGIQRVHRAETRPSKFPHGDVEAHAFIRVERQTLRKLPMSGDILFTIRIYLDPMNLLMRQPHHQALAASLAGQLESLDQAQLDYKGLSADRDRIAAMLRAIADA